MLQNFVGLGVQKAGTTSLYHYLRLHPEVYLPETEEINYKEINFFFHDYFYEKGLPYYKTFFKSNIFINFSKEQIPLEAAQEFDAFSQLILWRDI